MIIERHALLGHTVDADGVVTPSLETRIVHECEARVWLLVQRTLYQPIYLRTPARVLTYKAPLYCATKVLNDLDALVLSDGPVTVHARSEGADPAFTMRAD